MKLFVPILAFALLSFLLLGFSINYSNPDFALRPLLYFARLAAWVIALGASTIVFLRAILQRSLKTRGAVFFAGLAIMIFYPCDGFLRAYAEERVIRHKIQHRDPHDDMGPYYIYGSFSPGTGGSSRGAWDAAKYAWEGFCGALCFSVFWVPFVYFAARLAFRNSTD